ncbi:MAG: hypothetical protein DI623_12340 [Sphingomonas sanxanigenens]|uniref:DUF2635 domain-containing protein n=1 Tax=Sphingomonas sanxanigenens TaxID=397260 RepID=A0A2W5A546_9SPHN|nr:MAG: hypothetical protein DI623_12340 [Sphingomonas sanxanigenens]
MTEKVFVEIRAAEGCRVRHPGGALLTGPDAVEWSSYWQRRLDDGDIELASEKKKGN